LHVYISMEPQRLKPDDKPEREAFDKLLENLVKDGMRAQLKTASLLTGAKYVDLNFPPEPAPGKFVVAEKFADIPTESSSSEDLDQQIAGIAKKINAIPLDKIGQDLARSVASLNTILTTFAEQNTAAKMDATLANVSQASAQFNGTLVAVQASLKEMTQTMKSLDSALAPDSKTQYELNKTFQSVHETAQSLNDLLDKLNQKPDSLIFGNGHEK
jgi:paraquat-inducible protein B